MDEFRLDVHANDEGEPFAVHYFDHNGSADEVLSTATKHLLASCAEHNIAPDPDSVVGMVWLRVGISHAEWYDQVLPQDGA